MTDGALADRVVSLEGTRRPAGPYFVAQLQEPPLYLEGRPRFGQTDNRFVHGTVVTGPFDPERRLVLIRSSAMAHSAMTRD